MTFTPKQQRCIDLFEQYPGSAWSVDEMTDYLMTSNGGAARTVASLVRRGLVERGRVNGRVHYRPVDEIGSVLA